MPILEDNGEAHSLLICPGCGDHNLHQFTVEVFNRYREDDPTGFHAMIENHALNLDLDMAGNPSLRRDGLLIYFACEHCPGRVRLSIAQHKGATLVECSYSEPETD